MSLSGARPALSPDLFPFVFPFHVALDRDLVVVQVGPSFEKVVPGAAGREIRELLASVTPAVPLDFDSLAASGATLFILETSHPKALFRGQFLLLPDEDLLVFLGSPWADSPGSLAALLEKREAELQEANKRLSLRSSLLDSAEAMNCGLLETSPEAFVAVDEHGLVRTFNPAAEALFGWKSAELVGQNVSMLMPEPDRSAHDAHLSRYLETGERHVIGTRREVTAVRRDGTSFPCEISVGAVRTSAGVTFTAFVRDLSAQRAAQAALRESEADYRSVVEGVKEVVFRTDAESRWAFLSPSWKEVTGFPIEETLGKALLDFVHPDDRERNTALFAALIAGERDHCRHEVRFLTNGRDPRWIEVYARLAHGADGLPSGTTGTLSDVTERRSTESELRRANEAAVEATRLKSKFLANMSHEIRTPLNAVIGMTGLLLETRLTGEQQEFADTIRISGKTLLELINEILDFSKIESGRLEIVRAPFDLRECAEDAIDLVAPQAAEKGLELVLDVDAPAGSAWEGDEARIRQVVVNLLTNAVKFTSRGEVVLSVSAERPPEGRPELRFAVRDTGPGIPEEERDRLFLAFSQLDSATTRKHGGTGLGLAISRNLAEAMGGRVTAENAPGRGALFVLAVPVEEAPPRSGMMSRAPVNLSGARCLVVEDNDAAREAIVRLCRRLGLDVVADGSGEAALGRVSAGEQFAVVVADATLPGVPATALFRAFRSRFAAKAPSAVLLTPLGQRPGPPTANGDVFATVSKPVKLGALSEALAGALRVSWAGPPLPRKEKEVTLRLGDGRLLRVLVVDDSIVNQRVATRILEKLGLRPDLASNGLEALQAVKRQRYDIVLMDVQMPEMDGLEATRAIRSQLSAESQPRIVAMTAGAFREEQDRCLGSGMDDYLAKPVRPQDLLAALERNGAALDARRAATAIDAWETRVMETLRDLARVAGEEGDDFVSGTIDLFLEEAASGLAGLEAAVGSGDAPRIAFFAHGLKGTVRNLGGVSVGDALQELEDAARHGFSPNVAALLHGARQELERFRAFLESGRWKEGAARGGVP